MVLIRIWRRITQFSACVENSDRLEDAAAVCRGPTAVSPEHDALFDADVLPG